MICKYSQVGANGPECSASGWGTCKHQQVGAYLYVCGRSDDAPVRINVATGGIKNHTGGWVLTAKAQEMLDRLAWEEDQYDCDWNEAPDEFGLTHGWCHFYGGRASGNWPYPIVRREDGKVAFPPKDKANPFACDEWFAELKRTARSFDWVQDRVLYWHEILDTDGNGNFVVRGDKCHYCGGWNEWNRENYRETDGCCSHCGAI